eukprot:5754095-Amphidinium_carterae.1
MEHIKFQCQISRGASTQNLNLCGQFERRAAAKDVRGCKTYHKMANDPKPMLGVDQWGALHQAATESRCVHPRCST